MLKSVYASMSDDKFPAATPCQTAYLNRIQHFNDPRMPQCPQLAHRIFGQRQSGLVRIDIESEDAAFRTVVLYGRQKKKRISVCCENGGG